MKHHRLPIAWCAELGKEVTPYEAYTLKLNHLKEEFTFRCVECQKPLFLQQQRRGFFTHPFFKRPPHEDHKTCLENFYHHHVTEDLRHYLDFEEALFLMIATVKKLRRLLHILQISQEYLRDEKASFKTNAPSFDFVLYLNLTPLQHVYEALEETVRELEQGYKRTAER